MKNKISLITAALMSLAMLSPQNISANDDHSFKFSLVNDMSQILSGGVEETFSLRTLATANYNYQINKNFNFVASAAVLRGDNGNESMGDIQTYSNIDTEEFEDFQQIYVEYVTDSEKGSFKLGQLDSNADFAYTEVGSNFINSSMGYSPTIGYMVSYPEPKLGVMGGFKPTNNQKIKLGIYSDAGSELISPMFIAEYGQTINLVEVKVGAWFVNKEMNVINETPEDIFDPDYQQKPRYERKGDEGAYLTVETNLKKMRWFVQFGYANEDTHTVDRHLGAGLVIPNVLKKDQDEFGVAFTYARLSEQVVKDLPKSETTLEAYYQLQLSEHIVLKPDLQYIKNPASMPGLEDGLVFTLRTQISF